MRQAWQSLQRRATRLELPQAPQRTLRQAMRQGLEPRRRATRLELPQAPQRTLQQPLRRAAQRQEVSRAL